MKRRIKEGAHSMGNVLPANASKERKAPRHLPGEASFRVKLKRNPRMKGGGTA
ncbi:MAG: hypothetical protein LBD02_03575 [Christensenellaceae bacterium]|jgi:hypothetical protein|nr:hypothetical protein [Christensenellaceae bacterium]